jgi:hypothetical protein
MSKKIIATACVCVLVILGVALELSFGEGENDLNNAENNAESLIKFPDNDKFLIQTDENKTWRPRKLAETPRKIKALAPVTFVFPDNYYLTLAKDAELKLVNLNQDFAQFNLLAGRFYFDHRFSTTENFIQIRNLAISQAPFSLTKIQVATDTFDLENLAGDITIYKDNQAKKLRETQRLVGGNKIANVTSVVNLPLAFVATNSEASLQKYQFDFAELVKDKAYYQPKSTKDRKPEFLPDVVYNFLVINPKRIYENKLVEISRNLVLATKHYQNGNDDAAASDLALAQAGMNALAVKKPTYLKPLVFDLLKLYGSSISNDNLLPVKFSLQQTADQIFVKDEERLFLLRSLANADEVETVDSYLNLYLELKKKNSRSTADLLLLQQLLLADFVGNPAKLKAESVETLAELQTAIVDSLDRKIDANQLKKQMFSDELVTAIVAVEKHSRNQLLEPSQAAEILNKLISLLETYQARPDFSEYFESLLPGFDAKVKRLESA